MKTSGTKFAVVLALSVGALWTQAQAGGPEFSAETQQRGPGGQSASGKMFVGDGKVRIEMAAEDQQMVRITDEKRRVEWILFPDQKNYLERKAGPDQEATAEPDPASVAADPCAGQPGLTCKKLAEEPMGGRASVKWEISGNRDGKPVTTTQWIDKERGIPLRQEFPDGGKMTLSLVGKETLEGRAAEKWEMLVEAPGRQATRTFQWYDPELKLAIRQEFPGGAISELKNVRVGKQPDDLFVVPAGYTRAPLPEGKPQTK